MLEIYSTIRFFIFFCDLSPAVACCTVIETRRHVCGQYKATKYVHQSPGRFILSILKSSPFTLIFWYKERWRACWEHFLSRCTSRPHPIPAVTSQDIFPCPFRYRLPRHDRPYSNIRDRRWGWNCVRAPQSFPPLKEWDLPRFPSLPALSRENPHTARADFSSVPHGRDRCFLTPRSKYFIK